MVGPIITAARRFNDEIARTEPERVDPGVVEVRDALAHGRVVARQAAPPMILFKFSKPDGGTTILTHRWDLTESFLEGQLFRTAAEASKVMKHLGVKFEDEMRS